MSEKSTLVRNRCDELTKALGTGVKDLPQQHHVADAQGRRARGSAPGRVESH